jgi:hypothetical protein
VRRDDEARYWASDPRIPGRDLDLLARALETHFAQPYFDQPARDACTVYRRRDGAKRVLLRNSFRLVGCYDFRDGVLCEGE